MSGRASNDPAGGVASPHPRRRTLPLLAAPSTAGELNTYRVPLAPIACWRLKDGRFDFDSSFVRPEARNEFALLAPFARETPKPRPALFGHADPVGKDDYNKTLSGRRVRAIHAVLVRNADVWEDLYSNPFHGDAWGQNHLNRMLAALGFEGTARVSAFQKATGKLAVDGKEGSATRRELFLAYMDFLCVDDTGTPFRYALDDFLFRGSSPDLVGDVQACSEFNPVVTLSSDENKRLAKPDRDAANAPNRRVVIFLFPNEMEIDPAYWPCPSVSEGLDRCRRRFWSDADARREATGTRRTYAADRNTFACRFYERLAFHSPCENQEGPVGPGVVKFRIVRDRDNLPAAGAVAVIEMPDGSVLRQVVDANGEVLLQGVAGETFRLLDVVDETEAGVVIDGNVRQGVG